MNLEEQLKPIVEKALQVAEKTGEFALEQAPLLLQEFYNWHITSNVLWLIFALILVGIPFSFKLACPKEKKEGFFTARFLGKLTTDSTASIFYTLSIVIWSSALFIIFFSVKSLVKITVAPKLYLIEYFLK